MMYYGLDREFERIDGAKSLSEALDIFENSGELPSKPPFLDKRSGMILDDPEMLEKADIAMHQNKRQRKEKHGKQPRMKE